MTEPILFSELPVNARFLRYSDTHIHVIWEKVSKRKARIIEVVGHVSLPGRVRWFPATQTVYWDPFITMLKSV